VPASAGPMTRTWSATRVWSAPRSASEHTATLRTPIAPSVRATRQAISPRLAIRTLVNMGGRASGGGPRSGGPGAGLRVAGLCFAGLCFAGRPTRLALLEEGGEAFLRLLARAHLGQHARQPRAVLLPGCVGPQLEQRLDAPL